MEGLLMTLKTQFLRKRIKELVVPRMNFLVVVVISLSK
jgi:hypothetical protein